MSSMYLNNLKVSIFGQSHSAAIGVTVEGLPTGFSVDGERLCAFLSRTFYHTFSHTPLHFGQCITQCNKYELCASTTDFPVPASPDTEKFPSCTTT